MNKIMKCCKRIIVYLIFKFKILRQKNYQTRTTFVLLIFLNFICKSHACNENPNNTININTSIQTKYVWRGMEMMTEDATPVIFPLINYQNKGWFVYAMGGYSINGKYAEVDFGVSYTQNWLTVGFNDYYYPTTNSAEDKYFSYGKNTGHWLEGTVTIAPEKVPVSLTFSNFFAGADKNIEGKQAYSTYAELGTWLTFAHDNRLAMNVGVAFNESCYNGYEHGLGVSNVELKYTHNVEFKNGWILPVSVAYIVNPVREKSFVDLTLNFAF